VAVRRGVWLVLSLILLAVAISMTGVAVSYFVFSHGPTIPSRTTLVLRLNGDLAEMEGVGVLDQILPTRPTVRGIVDALQRAKTDPRVRHLLLVPQGSGPFWAKTQEIRDAITDFRKSGKKTVAFLEYGGDQEY
jgi:protease IV